jgi:hypothetical protein
MASAAENIERLIRFFTVEDTVTAPWTLIREARIAMRELVVAGQDNHQVRAQFANRFIFEWTLSDGVAAKELQVASPDGSRGEVRLTLIEGLYDSATGGWWGGADPSGIVEWLGSEETGYASVEETLLAEGNPDPVVIAALLRLLGQAAIPASWLTSIQQKNLFGRLAVRTTEAAWSPLERKAITALAAQAAARVGFAAGGDLSSLPSFKTGNGSQTPTLPPPSKRWYRSGWTWLAGAAGLVGGGALAGRGRRRHPR